MIRAKTITYGMILGAAWEYDSSTGGALRFDGIDDYIVIPHSSSLDVTRQITITALVYPELMSGFCPHVVGKMISEIGQGGQCRELTQMEDSKQKYEKSTKCQTSHTVN